MRDGGDISDAIVARCQGDVDLVAEIPHIGVERLGDGQFRCHRRGRCRRAGAREQQRREDE
jgi:hypothetical protein